MKIEIKYYKIFILLALALLAGCSSADFPDYSSGIIPLYERPGDWGNTDTRSGTVKGYSKYLRGKKIFLDPGHGGSDRKNKSKSGKIVEADVNLRVALYLKEYLEEAGSEVIMSRNDDSAIPLNTRSNKANSSGADIFISIHHNAGGNAEDYASDYTSTYYHSTEDNFNYEPCNRDLARYIQRDLSYVMRTSGGLGSFDGTYSDYVNFPKMGYAVLRNSKIPAVLVECAFHTSRFEEARLGFEEFNEIQAWGIFKGIGKYFKAGIPVINFDKELSTIKKDSTKLIFSFSDKSGIDEKSIQVYCDSVKVNYFYNKNINILEISLSGIQAGEHTIRIIAANKNKNYAFPFYAIIKIE
jgi:N-acetylmuramoyl-L-alanine amidase